ncbi:hypothetical protein WR25_10500 isoform C [Diploscapter pachys]|uniref:FERM domain-containing protein n=1 Tax=Diploscapter pachys TaxID=2018661 RepID=A0A2A2JYK0_9BILA|nr:hypothetical protein WR25_10500 isoform B [Diploscapter pachys]PAV66775.1 hypothetical protein WR25_10500 isoform C [Diploscapter pachys]
MFSGLPYAFSYEVKFYPVEPNKLDDVHARKCVYLQLRRDIQTGRLPMTLNKHAQLGSFAAQAEFGDASIGSEAYANFLKTAKITPDMNEQMTAAIASIHQQHRGLSNEEALIKYLEICKDLPTYGIWMFKAKDTKSDDVDIGVGAHGISIYKDGVRMSKFNWQNIVKISYRRATFSIKVKPWELNPKEATVSYKMEDFRYSKRVFKVCVEHHTHFRLIEPEETDAPPAKKSLFAMGTERFGTLMKSNRNKKKNASELFDETNGQANVVREQRMTTSLNDVNEHSANSSVYNDGNPHSEVGSPAMSYRLDGLRRTAKSPASVTTAEEMSQNGDSLQEETQLELIDTKRVKFGDRTVETLTYKNGRNFASKIHVELRVTVISDKPIDHDKELDKAILTVTNLNQDATVDKIDARPSL